MLDLDKALVRLKKGLSKLNFAMGVFEVMATERYQERRKRALKQPEIGPSLVPPPRLDPDVTLWH